MTPEMIKYLCDHQDEWRQMYKKQRKQYKLQKNREEKKRAKELKNKNKIDLKTI
jgi:hypothetical protein